METFNLSFNDIMYKYSWVNIILLMTDKLKYKGSQRGKEKVIDKGFVKHEEEADFFKSLM